MTITVKAAGAAQFLSLIPHLLGCTPTRSLVLVPLAHGRTLGAMRLDLPPEPESQAERGAGREAGERIDAVASSAIGMVCRIAEADALIAVVYTDEAIGERGSLPGAAMIDAVDTRADACGLHLLDALTVASDGWGSHDDPDLPAAGRSLDEVTGANTPPGMPDGIAPARDQRAGAALPRVAGSARAATALALRSLSAALEAICGIPSLATAGGGGEADADGSGAREQTAPRIDPAALEAACELDDLPTLYEGALAWHVGESPMRAAMLGWCLSRPSLRDIALVQWASDVDGGDIAMEAQRRWEDGAEYPPSLAATMWGEGARPDPERLESALAVVREVAALLPKSHRPGPLAVCAWISWALGRSSHADRYAGMALALDRRHGLAEIVLSFVQAGHLPDWAFRGR